MVTKQEHEIYCVANGTVVTPKGFKAAGVHAGLRYIKKDLGVIVCDVPASCAAVYTQSHFQAAPLKVTQESIAVEQKLQAIVVNSACANACTGEQGLKDAYEMRELCALQFGLPSHYVAVASTGVIGEFLPMEKIREGIKKLQPSVTEESAHAFQTAILTTDTVMKQACYQTTIEGKTVTIGGAAKGSGMIHPNMATMLAFITTDANISSSVLQEALRSITDLSFNQITVDGDTSTNDMVVVMASGLAETTELTPRHPEWNKFYDALKKTCEDLAKQIAKDGEGATKLIEVRVSGAVTDDDAKRIAKQIVGSNLVKTAVYGADANWGRIIGAIGYADATVNPDCVDITLGDIVMLKASEPQPFSEEEATAYLQNHEIMIHVDLHLGNGTGVAWGCDLTYDYVKINASYRT
ncbi:glutamate N-acetyltransferase/amino-acid acetyltransferase [Anoxybacillus sp. B7M1]|uniref:bifunctional ornithine acetyltransferase/N-acetylglutamate synthase n=1 Tax=unclassified Anoxybacillus TaxID=2639704 RepID=UPI0005CCE49E|nr:MULTISPECIES: bifunctional ornithine acetyltransferase/N-acetylglutamate synthase [unclassified Anoxybacillus]ANB56201.1 glutamate N-acetyltransferase/amino-acid acetyltransferase [Anoxybacillus sp. B2M1]ANB64367.1 glutamate N-acetyltransferase/amino-acid acetyltransferase [Anoxybacillus sp. B7M1]